jgi:tetratricopeptide (TPR) repeat protein
MPQDFRLHFNLGETCAATGRYQEALSYYNQIPKNHPQLAATDLRIANCYGKMGNHAQANSLLQGVLNNPQMPEQLKNAARTILAGKTLPNSALSGDAAPRGTVPGRMSQQALA